MQKYVKICVVQFIKLKKYGKLDSNFEMRVLIVQPEIFFLAFNRLLWFVGTRQNVTLKVSSQNVRIQDCSNLFIVNCQMVALS